jgi:hypothetical protein
MIEDRRPDVRVSSVTGMEAALQIVQDAAPSVILLADEFSGDTADGNLSHLKTKVNALAMYAPVVFLGAPECEGHFTALLAGGVADYVPRNAGCLAVAMDLLESRLPPAPGIAEGRPALGEDRSRDFAEVLRHELNNPLTGILGNAELLLAAINRETDGKLPHGGQERVETIAALAIRMRETVRQLSEEWEARAVLVRTA